MKSSMLSSPKKSPSNSPRTSSKSSQSNPRKSTSSTPTKNSSRSPAKNSQVSSQTSSPTPKNSSRSSSKSSQINSQFSPQSLKKSPNAKKIQELRLLHKNAINNLDFAEAANIEKNILELKAGNLSDQLNTIKVEFGELMEDLINSYKQRLQDLEKSKEDSAYDFRCQINTLFENLKSKQMKEMVELEKVYAHDRLRENQRIFPQYESIILQAKSAGVLHDYKSALELQNSALIVSQSMLDKRLALIDKDYELKNESLLQKHTKEVILLVKRLEDGLKKVEDKTEASLAQEKTLFDIKLMKEYKKTSKKVQLQTTDASPVMQEIDQILNNIFAENEMEIPKILSESMKNSSKVPFTNLVSSPK